MCTCVRIRHIHASSIQMLCDTAVPISYACTYLVLFYLFHFTFLSAMKVEVEKSNGSDFEVELDSVMVSVDAQNDTGTLYRCEVL